MAELPIWKPPIELASAGPCPGAACCQLTELPTYKAAPLQGLGPDVPSGQNQSGLPIASYLITLNMGVIDYRLSYAYILK